MKTKLRVAIPSLSTRTGPRLQRFATSLRCGCGAAAIAMVLAACGGGDGQTITAEAQAQRDQTAAIMQAQQSVTALRAAVVQPGSGTEDFEAGMGDWQNWGNAQVVAGAGTGGSSALQVGSGAGGAALQVPGIVGGTTYRLTAQVRATDPSEGPATLGVDFYDASGARILGTRAPSNVTNTSLAPFTYEVQAPAGSSYARVWIWKNGNTGFAYLDDVAFAAASAPPPPPPPPPASNLLSNGGFEAGMTGWVDWGNTQIVNGQANSGTAALSVGAAAGGAGHNVDGIVPGTSYRLGVSAKVSDASETVFVGVNFLDAAGSLVGSTHRATSSTSYTAISADVVAPPGAVRAVMYVWKNAGGGLGHVDDFAFGVASGSTPPPPTGANVLLNGTFESGLASWVNWGNATTSGQAAAGTSAAQVGTGAGGLGQSVTGIVPGDRYRVIAQVKVSSAEEIGYLGLKFLDDAGNSLQDAAVPFSTTAYSSAQLELVAPANATTALVFLWKNAGGGFAFLDEAALQGEAASPAVLANVNTTARGVAVLNTGTRVAAWGDDTGVHAQRFDGNGGLVGSALLIAPSGTFNGMAALAGGGYVVEYTQPGAVLVQLVSAAGALAGAPVTVRTQAQVEADGASLINPTLRGGAGVYPLGGGGFAALYVESHVPLRYDVPINSFAQRFDASGNVVGARMGWEAAIFAASTPTGGLIIGREWFTWTLNAGRSVFNVVDSALQRLASYTSPVGEGTAAQGGAGLRNGSYIAIWTSGTAVRGQLFAPDAGSPSGTRDLGPVVTFTNAGAGARVTGLAGGGFLLSWGASAQAFDENAQPVGGMMQILGGSIAATPDGGFVVVAQVGSQLVAQQYAIHPGT